MNIYSPKGEGVLLIPCLIYLLIAIAYNHYAMLSVDEFWFAHRVYEYRSGLPYRDFAPYKTILGYYLLLPTLIPGKSIMSTLYWMKDALALLNTILLFISSCWLTRFFSRNAVLASLAVLISAEIMITYSTQIRVDLPGYWFGFFALLLFLEKRYFLAGLLMAAGFCTTQKLVWYMFAINVAFGLQWLIDSMDGLLRPEKRLCHDDPHLDNNPPVYERQFRQLKPLVIFNTTICIGIFAYLTFWSTLSDWQTVIQSVFHEASAMYRLDAYAPARKGFWQTILSFNPLLFLLSPVTAFSLFITYDADKNYRTRLFVIIFSLVVLSCLIHYKQIFPYYTQVTLPVFFILYAAFFDWSRGFFREKLRFLIPQKFLWCLTALYSVFVISLIYFLHLPMQYLLICLIPFSMMMTSYKKILLVTLILIGFVYPLSLTATRLASLNASYQRANVEMINNLLQQGGDYVSGIEFIYNKSQPIPGMRNLMAVAIMYLSAHTPQLRAVMTPSQYEDPEATTDSALQHLQNSQVKFYVNNYRMNAVPKRLAQYLDSQYVHWWGSIYFYAPRVVDGEQEILLKFAGNYVIDADKPVMLDGKQYLPHAIVTLEKGKHLSNADGTYRLKLIPNNSLKPDPEFMRDEWDRMTF